MRKVNVRLITPECYDVTVPAGDPDAIRKKIEDMGIARYIDVEQLGVDTVIKVEISPRTTQEEREELMRLGD